MSEIGARMTLLAAVVALGLAAAGPARAEPQVASVSEPRVRLEAGGRPVTLTLQGTDLDQLQSAAVVLGAQPAPGLTAQLGPPAKTSRTVTLRALASAKPGKDYKLQLAGAKAPLTPTVALEVAAPPAPAPKLVAPAPAVPKVEAPKLVAPAPAVPKVEAPRLVAPAPTAPKVEAPKLVAPAPTAPKVEAPKLVAPAPTAPKVEAPKLVAPAPTAPPKVEPPPAAPAAVAPKLAAPAPAPAAKVEAPKATRVAPSLTAALQPEPRVASVTPPAVRVQAGGAAVVLTLIGQELDRLQSASVLRGSQAATGVTARLGPPAKTSRTVTLTAQASAVPGRDYRVQASGGRQPLLLATSVEVYWPVTLARPLLLLPAAPVLARVEPTADGYALVGKGFGTNRSRLQVFEGSTQVGTLVSLADDRIVVRSRPSGVVQHRVVVGGLPSATVVFTHRTAPAVVGSVGVSSSELAKILQSPKVRALAAAPTPPGVPTLRPGAAGPTGARPAAGSPGPTGGVSGGAARGSGGAAGSTGAAGGASGGASGLSGPSGPAGAGSGAPSGAPASRGAGRSGASFRPRSQTTGELTMSGIGR